MGEIGRQSHLRVVEGRPWKQALICALNPEAPFAPWAGIDEVARGDVAAVVIDTDPRTLLCAFVWDGTQDRRHSITAETFGRFWTLPPVAGVEAALGFSLETDQVLDGAAAEALVNGIRVRGFDVSGDRAGDSSVAIARILVGADGRCTCCREKVVMTTEDDLDRLVHTAYGADVMTDGDWPALLCPGCETAMREGGFTSVVDFVFSRRPACPACSARRAKTIGYGMPSYHWIRNMAPWESSGGCVIDSSSSQWICGECGHEWGELTGYSRRSR